jgi:hypothetical protein
VKQEAGVEEGWVVVDKVDIADEKKETKAFFI